MQKSLLAAAITLAAALAGGAAEAKVPVFAAQCPDNIAVDADRHGKVYINGKSAKVKELGENSFEARDHGITISFGSDPGGANLSVMYTGKHGANGICQVTAQQNASSGSSGGGAPSQDEQACLQAVTQQTNNPDVVLLSTETSEANTLVMVGVGDNKAPWRCLAKNGIVDEVISINN